MKYTFQHFIDISTSADSLTMIQFNAGGKYTLQRIKHLLGAFKYIKYGRISIKLLPASTLPVDPLGLGYESDDPQTVDPRDQMNPGLVRITNGEDILTDFTGMNADSQEQLYINTMLDPRWSKFMLQSGFKRSAVPLYWNVGQLHQDPYPGAVVNVPQANSAFGDYPSGVTTVQMHDITSGTADLNSGNIIGSVNRVNSDPRGLFQTGHRGRMSWMPTDAFYNFAHAAAAPQDYTYAESEWPMVMPLPEVQCITCLLPKAYKTKYYYRCFITETVYLSGLKNTGINDAANQESRAIDNFIYVPFPQPKAPQIKVSQQGAVFGRPDPMNDGGGE